MLDDLRREIEEAYEGLMKNAELLKKLHEYLVRMQKEQEAGK